jgi:hypothetical protein
VTTSWLSWCVTIFSLNMSESIMNYSWCITIYHVRRVVSVCWFKYLV